MQGPPATVTIAPQSCTILRIKRKRNEEPLDALVVDSRVRRKKSRGGVGVFQYAQTVENDAWDDVQRQKDIQAKISQLSLETAAKGEWHLPTAADLVPPSPSHPPKDDGTRRYTIVQQEQYRGTISRFPTSPPKVLSSKDIARSPVDFKMYDAIPADQQSLSTDESSEVNKFLPMLNDYLKIHDIDIGSETNTPALKKPSDVIGQHTSPQSALDGDYVWDVFYHRPATLSEWNEAANVGTLTGLPPSFGAVYDSASDSEEEEDEADEDSNAEEYYKNDYPDEIDNSENSDEFHEDSEYEEYNL